METFKTERAEITLRVSFPLLNKGEFFVVKLLLSGYVPPKTLRFQLLADNLPRELSLASVPPSAVSEEGYKFDWGLAVAASIVLAIPTWLGFVLFRLYESRPELSPYPWAAYELSLESALVLVPGTILTLFLTVIGLMMWGAALFSGEFPPRSGPKFPLPEEIRSAMFPHPRLLLEVEAQRLELEAQLQAAKQVSPNKAMQPTGEDASG